MTIKDHIISRVTNASPFRFMSGSSRVALRQIAGAIALAAAMGSSAEVASATPFPDPGPGFSASNYVANASANACTASDLGINSLPNGMASGSVELGPTCVAHAMAGSGGLHVDALTEVPGGAGEAGASASLKILYQIANNPTKAVIPFTFSFSANDGGSFTPVGGPLLGSATISTDFFVGSDKESFQKTATTSISKQGGNQPTTSNNKNFTVTDIGTDNKSVSLNTTSTNVVHASEFVVVQFDLILDIANLGVIPDLFLDSDAVLANVPANFAGDVPQLIGPNGIVIPVTRASAPEPNTLALFLAALFSLRQVKRWRSERRHLPVGSLMTQ
jgi:hypothetical protein